MNKALAEALQVPRSVIKPAAPGMDAPEKRGCEGGRVGVVSKRHRQLWREEQRNESLQPHLPKGQRDQAGTQPIQRNIGHF